MKKIKLFALAAFAMLSTNVFAFDKEATVGIWKIAYTDADAPSDGQIVGFKNDIKATDVTKLEIPASLVDNENAGKTVKIKSIANDCFKTSTVIKSIQEIDMTNATNLEFIGTNAFEGATALTTVKFGPKLTTAGGVNCIGAQAFKGCTSLATVSFATAADGVADQSIGAGAFDGAIIETLDLTNAKIVTLNQLFTLTSGGTTSKNKKLTTITLPATMTTIGVDAFKNCQKLQTVNFATAVGAGGLTVSATAFDGTVFLEAIELPARTVAISPNALTGSSIETLTINANATAGKPTVDAICTAGDNLTSIIVKDDFVGVFGNATPAGVAPSLTSLTFKGKVGDGTNAAILAGAFDNATKLESVTFEKLVKAGAVAAGAFGSTTTAGTHAGSANYGADATWRLEVTYEPTTDDDVAVVTSFNGDAFGDGAHYKYVSFVTSTAYSATVAALSRVDVSAAAATKTIKVENNGEGKYFYGSFYDASVGGNYKIAAEQNGGKVMVYAAYMDQVKSGSTTTNTAYMDQLTIIGGYYWIPADNPVVVKSTTSTDVVAEKYDDVNPSTTMLYTSMHYGNKITAGAVASLNKIGVTDADYYGKELKDANPGMDVYFLAPFKDYGLLWSKFKDTRELPKGTFYMTINAAAGARLNVVWLDGSEEDATAIQTVKKANAESGAIFNLAGQKVNASYKGVVIKDGKKYIQK